MIIKGGHRIKTLTSGSFAAVYVLCIALLTVPVPASAIEDRPAPGRPETMLAGVRMGQTRLTEVIRMYGPPTLSTTHTGYIHENPEYNDSHKWIKLCIELNVYGLSGEVTAEKNERFRYRFQL